MNLNLTKKNICPFLIGIISLAACDGGVGGSNSNTVSTTNGTSSTYCQFTSTPVYLDESVSDTATSYNPIPGGVSSYAYTDCSSGQREITGNGVPNNSTGTFPNSGNPNAMTTQKISFIATLTPVKNSKANYLPVSVPPGYLNNGIKLDPISAETVEANGQVWNIEALGQSVINFGIDYNNAHIQPNGAYHQHGLPIGYINAIGAENQVVILGFAIDGFPIYSNLGYSDPNDVSSPIRNITPSWKLKKIPDSGRPSTTTYPMGTFAQDYEYIAGSGDLDECNGRFSKTQQYPNGIYQYYITESFPYIQRCIYGNK